MRGINDIVLLLSTDCFSGWLFSDIPDEYLEKLKCAFRSTATRILKDVKDYWQDTWNKKEDEEFFFQELKRISTDRMVLQMILQKVFLFNIIITKDEDGEKAVHLIRSISSRLRCLATERFSVPINDEIIDAVIDIQNEKFSVDAFMRILCGNDADNQWEISCSNSQWDKYIVGVMEELPDYLPGLFDEIFNS
jgi:hypothetical protein